jgi:hypothetical protein
MDEVAPMTKLVLVEHAAERDVASRFFELDFVLGHPSLVVPLPGLGEFLQKAEFRARRRANDAIWLLSTDLCKGLGAVVGLAKVPPVGQIERRSLS